MLGIVNWWNLVLVIQGFVVLGVGGRFLIHYLYKMKTGKDTPGMRFWKWILKK